MSLPRQPAIHLQNCQRRVRLASAEIGWLQTFANRALQEVLQLPHLPAPSQSSPPAVTMGSAGILPATEGFQPEANQNNQVTHCALNNLDELSIVLVSDRTMAQLHRDFMNLAGPTDVLTFEHGEIVISTETAARYAVDYRHSTLEEIALYILHGLLHLQGHDDRTPADHQAMHRVQTELYQRLNR